MRPTGENRTARRLGVGEQDEDALTRYMWEGERLETKRFITSLVETSNYIVIRMELSGSDKPDGLPKRSEDEPEGP